MRLVFAGTPAFAAVSLEALLAAGHEVVLVLTQPDRPAGRGMSMRASDVKQLAQARGLAVAQPPSLRGDSTLAQLAQTNAAAMVVAAYGLILPQSVLDAFPRGCINIHASLLPRWRGAAPIQRAILAGDTCTGISIMQMDAGLDTGPVLLAEAIPIAERETAQSLHDRLAELGGRSIVRALAQLDAGQSRAVAQPQTGATYATKLAKEEAEIDWRRSAVELDRQVRAFNPFPVAATSLEGAPLKIWRAHPLPASGLPPGVIQEASGDRLIVACGEGALALEELQRAGGKRMPVREFLRGSGLSPGQRLGAA
jgi:methionyl-tRNA formyltransferase